MVKKLRIPRPPGLIVRDRKAGFLRAHKSPTDFQGRSYSSVTDLDLIFTFSSRVINLFPLCLDFSVYLNEVQ